METVERLFRNAEHLARRVVQLELTIPQRQAGRGDADRLRVDFTYCCF
jgi:hypothetical protein